MLLNLVMKGELRKVVQLFYESEKGGGGGGGLQPDKFS